MSRQLGTTVHQYDCFNLTRFRCDLGRFQFHEECIDDRIPAQDGRLFDTLTSHLARNGDEGKRLIVKMDVEGSEWSALATTPDSVLFVNKRIGVPAASNTPPSLPHSLDAPSNPGGQDCQPAF